MSNRAKIRDRSERLRRVLQITERAVSLSNAGELDAAEILFRNVVAMAPFLADAWANLGSCMVENGKCVEAAVPLRRALEIDSGHAQAHHSISVANRLLGDIQGSVKHTLLCLKNDPNHAKSRLQLAHLSLLTGDWASGWALHERAREEDYSRDHLSKLLRCVEDAADRDVLVVCEQGFGDDIQFVRYVPMLADAGARVTLACKPACERLFRSLRGVDRIMSVSDPPPKFDWFAPTMRLAHLFDTRTDTTFEVPYLHADPGDVERFSHALRDADGLKIGLCWAGGARKTHPHLTRIDARRSMRLADFETLSEIPGVTFMSLQMGDGSGQEPPEGMRLVDVTGHIRDFADTAALVENLDLVVTVDTSVAHLAGALGKPVWMLSRFDGCWRWLTNGDTTCWYPTMRIYRQDAPRDWASVVDRVAEDLAGLVRAP